MTRVLLVDDHPVVRAGMRALLEASGVQVAAEADSGALGVRAAHEHDIDVVLMDLQLGSGFDGVEATRQIRSAPNPPPVLILTTYDTDTDILRAIEAGAAGYLLKDAPVVELLDAVERVAGGETVLAATVATKLVSSMRSGGQRLSDREVEVLAQVASGASNRQVAAALVVSEATVKSHLVHIFDKLGVASRTAAVAAARSRGLLR